MIDTIMNSNKNILGKDQAVINMGEYKAFYSYESLIAVYNTEECKVYLKENMWDYSNTTRKYFKKFLEEHTCIPYNNKKMFLNLIQDKTFVVKL